MMERPAKRPRIGSFLPHDDDADDELFLDPSEVNAQRDPAVQLEQSRAVASYKLKSRWEDVIARFEKDFTGEDDIINFYTDELPEVEVDHGHLRSLPDPDDAKSVAGSDSADVDEEERILQGKGAGDGQLVRAGPSSLMPRPAYGGRLSGLGSLAPGPPRLSTMFSTGLQFQSFSPFSPFPSFKDPVESVWNAPELPAEAFHNHAIATAAVRRRVTVKALPAPGDDDSDEDDILMGGATSMAHPDPGAADQAAQPPEPAQVPSPAPGHVLSEKATSTELSHPTAIVPEVLEETAARPKRRKSGRPKAVIRRPDPATEDKAVEEAAPHLADTTQPALEDPAAATQGLSDTTLAVPGTQEAANAPTPRKPGRPRATPHKSSEAVTHVILEDAAPGIAAITETAVESQNTAEQMGQTGRRKPGRRRKSSMTGSSVQKRSSARRSEALTIAASDAELEQSSPVVASAADRPGPDESSNDTSSAGPSRKPTNSLVRIEVRLFRRHRPSTVQLPKPSDAPMLAECPPETRKELSTSSVRVGKKACVQKKKRRVASIPSVPPPPEDERHHGQSQTPAASPSVLAATPVKNSNGPEEPTQDDVVMKDHVVPASEGLERAQRADEQQPKEGVPAERFSRNIIDGAYGFSDDDEVFAPRSRAKKSAKQTKQPKSTPRRVYGTRVKDNSALWGSSPSVRAAFPAVKKQLRSSSSAKAPEETTAPQTKPVDITGEGLLSGQAQSTRQVEVPATEASEHPKPSPRQVDDPLSPGRIEEILEGLQSGTTPTTPSSQPPKEKPAAPFATPSSRQPKTKPSATPSATRPSPSKRSILSLLSDSDEDELSLSLDQISPLVRTAQTHHSALPIRSRSTVKKKPSFLKGMSLGSHLKATPTQKKSKLRGGWKSASTTRVAPRVADVVNDGDVHRTPGGTMRKCGEDGFKCERDFCFACL